jgi:hypothetical protein
MGNDMNFKWLLVPFSNNTKKVQVAQLWEVRWISLSGDADFTYHRPEMEAFTSEEEARHFVRALKNAVELLRHGVDYEIEIEKGKGA